MVSARTLLAILGVTALGLAGCSSGSGGGTSATAPAGGGNLANGKTFTMAIATDPGNLDPHQTVLSVTRQVDRFLYARLLGQDDNGKAISSLAEKWEADTSKATFTLRNGITCADGTPLTASDVAANISYVGDPKNKSPLAGLSVQRGTSATGDDAARTVTVTSGAPDAFLLVNAGSVPIVCGKGLTDRSLLAKGGAGTGMFTVSETVPSDHYTFTRRKDFTWGPGDWKADQPGLPDTVTLKVIANETTAANLLVSGGLNAASVPGPDQDRLAAQKLFHVDTLSPVGMLWFNQAEGRPAAEAPVRKALVQALDRNKLGQVLTSGKGKPSTGMVTLAPNPCRTDTVTGNIPAFDTAAAQSALDAAGWVAGSDGVRAKGGKKLSLTVIYVTTVAAAVPTAELIQSTLKGIGVETTLKGVDSTGLNEVLFKTGEWDISMGPLTTSLPSQVVPFMSGPAAPQGVNFAHVSNADYDAGVKTASGKAGEAGCSDWAAAEGAAIKAADVVPYYNTVVPTFGKQAQFAINDALDPATIRMFQ
jgi:peptide/nickel transport system substrate-binding protein